MKDLTGVTIERYKILNELGRGGMAVVYRAMDTMLDRKVAIKIILPETVSKEKSLKRFSREAKTLANLSYSNIVKVLDYGEYEGSPYLVMEYVAGGTLSARLGKPMPYTEAAAILAPIARALHHAHMQKVVHRDIKPSNILINEMGQPMLSDFGILKLIDVEETQGITGTGKSVGTPAYMSPEQIRGKEIDGRTDIYSLGVVFFELLTGRKPYNATTPIEVSLQHLHDPIPKAKQHVRDLPASAEQVLVNAMAKNPEDRYPSMLAFAHALEKLAGITTVTPSTGWDLKLAEAEKTREKATPKVNRALFIAVPILLVVVLSIALFRPNGLLNPSPLAEPTDLPEPMPTVTLSIQPTSVPPSQTSTPVENTPAVGFTLEIKTPTPVPASVIKPSNIAQLAQINRAEKISVVKTEWLQSQDAIVNVGSGAITIFDPVDLSPKEKINMPGEVPQAMTVSSATEKLYLLVGGNVRVYDLTSYKLEQSFPTPGGTISISVSQDGKLLALGISDNKVQIISAEDGHVINSFRSYYGGWSVAFSPDAFLVAGGTSQGVLMWEVETSSWVGLDGNVTVSIKSLAFSNDGKMLAGGGDGVIYVWNVEDGSLLFDIDGDFGDIHSLDFSPDNLLLVSASEDGSVRLWNISSGSMLRSLTGHTSPVYSANFSPSGQYIVSGANEGTIRVWGIP